MSGQLRRDRPRPPRRRRGRVRSVVVAASGVVALVAALALPHIDTMAWFGIDSGPDDSEAAALRLLEADGQTPGERVADVLVKDSKPKGFKARKTTAAVSDVFGLTCLDGPIAWASARSRSLEEDDGEAVVSALVYPAGGGGAAFAQTQEAAGRCAEQVAETEFGVTGLEWRKGNSVVHVLRRGDVLAVVSATSPEALPPVEWLGGLDDRLTALVQVDCIDVEAPAEASLRNPFIDPDAFTGNTVAEPVPFPEVDLTRAEDVATDPVVPLDSLPPVLPGAIEVPAPLDPVAPSLPPLPTEVLRPEAPVPPVAPDPEGMALRGVADSAGPGCGWDFTGQAGPRFDEQRAEGAHRAAVAAERTRLVDEAVAFEQGKVNFYRAWAEHQAAATAYQQYVDELASVVEQWQVVVDARQAFAEAFAAYRSEVEVYDDFVARQGEARTLFDAETLRCQSLSPLEALLPGSGCPPERPTVLDEVAPVVATPPVPAPEAQLPEGWEPPVEPAEE